MKVKIFCIFIKKKKKKIPLLSFFLHSLTMLNCLSLLFVRLCIRSCFNSCKYSSNDLKFISFIKVYYGIYHVENDTNRTNSLCTGAHKSIPTQYGML